jgi:hypothetical protein
VASKDSTPSALSQEQVFIDQAAHLFLALAGIKPLPKQRVDLETELPTELDADHL